MTLIDHILFFLFGVLLPLQSVFRARPMLRQIGEWDTPMKLAFYRANSLVLWLLAALAVGAWLWQGRPAADMGFRWPLPNSWPESLLISAGFVLAYAFDVWRETATPAARERTLAEWRRYTPFLPVTPRELRGFSWLALSAGVGEEILFRGFALQYLHHLFQSFSEGMLPALLVSTLIFAFSHAYQGWEAVIKIGVLSLAFGLLFLLSGSLLLPIVLHVAVDLLGGWLGYRLNSF